MKEMEATVRLRLGYTGDYPGQPCAWVNGRLISEADQKMLIKFTGSDETRGLIGLMEHMGAERTKCGREFQEWEGNLKLIVAIPESE